MTFHRCGVERKQRDRRVRKRHSGRGRDCSLHIVRLAVADVVRVDVDRFGECPLHHLAGAQDEPLEVFRQYDHLLLLGGELFHCW